MPFKVVDLEGSRRQLDEHRAVREAMESILHFVEHPPPQPVEHQQGLERWRRWSEELDAALGRLAAELSAHFANEEASAPYVSASDRFLRFAHQLEGLRAQHEEILEALGAARRDAHHAADTGRRMETLGRLREVFAMIGRHEAAENRILQEAYGSDLGAGD